MKNLRKIILVVIAGLFSIACSEEAIIDLQPVNNILLDQAFSTPALIESSVNGMYNAAAIGQYNSTTPNGGRGYVWGAAYIQQGDCRGEDAVSVATFYQATYAGTYDQTTANNVYYWVDGYRLINRCNLIIEGVTDAVNKGIITGTKGDDYIGQAKYLRAITHFELLMYFARPYQFTAGASHPGIPYREVAVDTPEKIETELLKGRNSVAECYDKVLTDLTDAENMIANTTLSYASKNAAIAFKTRVYLHKRDWDNVINEGIKLNGLYTLTPTPVGPFANNYANTESIFSIKHSSATNPGVNAALASQYKRRLLIAISPIIWRDPSWLADDKRREEGVMVFTSEGKKFTFKYKDENSYTDATPVIRYAEVILNMAEANARKASPDLTESLTLLNQIRNRALADVATQEYTAASFSSATDLVGLILKERRIEFLLEGRRWSDIHRLQNDDMYPIDGIPAKLVNDMPAASTYVLGTPYTGPFGVAAVLGSDYRFLWPIPQIEINANPTLAAQQNPGW